jgi:hypothetical protein
LAAGDVTEVILKRRAGRAGEVGLFPVDSEGEELMRKLRNDRDVGADIVQRRNPRHHRLFFAMLKFIQMHCEIFSETPIEEIKDAVKLATGYVKRFVDVDTAKTFYVCKSISWSAMDQTEFNKFFDSACVIIANRWMPHGSAPEDVRKELLTMIGEPT